jgi:hypothetical protein
VNHNHTAMPIQCLMALAGYRGMVPATSLDLFCPMASPHKK